MSHGLPARRCGHRDLDPGLEVNAGRRRVQYLYDALRDLNRRLDGRLLVTHGRAETRIPALANAIEASAVHVSPTSRPTGCVATRR